MRKFLKWIGWLSVIYVAGGVALYFLQDAILFHPVRLTGKKAYDFDTPHREFAIPINNTDTLSLVHFLPADSVRRGVVLYFHGNKRNIGWYARFAPYFTRNGYELIMIDYPGFGKSTGHFNEKILYQWSRIVYRYARSRYSPENIVVYGKSMGTGLAAYLASRDSCHRLILETPYYDLPSVVSHYLPIYPVRSLLHYEIPTHEFLTYVTCPVSIFQGTADGVVTYSNASRLKPMLKKGDEFITIEGGSHNDLFSYALIPEKLDSLLQR